MNWYSQLTHLIFDYYREDPTELEQLSILKRCKLSRRWGTLRVICSDRSTAEALILIESVLKAPIIELRLARHINVLVNSTLIASLSVTQQTLEPSEEPSEF